MLAFALSEDVWDVALARMLQAIALAYLWLAADAITADSAGADDRGRSFGSVAQSRMLGSLLGTFAGFGIFWCYPVESGFRSIFSQTPTLLDELENLLCRQAQIDTLNIQRRVVRSNKTDYKDLPILPLDSDFSLLGCFVQHRRKVLPCP
jgi:hypothetical protein